VKVLIVNAGSSSLKLRLLGPDDELLGTRDLPADAEGLDAALAGLRRPDAVGHRVVHGGERFREPVVIDAAVTESLRGLTALAPLHQPKSLAALDAVSGALPDVPAVACFDTAFHATMPEAAATYAVPAEWRERWRIRRYGFHGLSHAWASRRAGDGRVVTCHLGAGASLAAVRDGRCLDTTMGFTPLEGLVMATRSGSVDPGLLMWLMQEAGMAHGELAQALEHESGLVGLAGTADMREVVANGGLALDVYLHSLRAHIAAMAAAAGGLDTLVFTGRVGERSAEVRAGAAEGLGFLGVEVDAERNARGEEDIGAGPVRVMVVEAREDLEMARGVRRAVLSAS
jgi:acetate kinase